MIDSGNTSLEYSRQFKSFELDPPDDLDIDAIDFSDIDFTLHEQNNNSQSLKRKQRSHEREQTLKKFCAPTATSEQFTQFTRDATKYFKVTCSMIKKSPCFGQDTNNNIIAQPLSVDLLVQSASANTSSFLGYGQDALAGRSFKSMFKSSETSKLDALVKDVSEQVAIKPFHALMIAQINDHEDHMQMIVWPVVKKFSKNIFVEFFVQKLDDFQSRAIESNENFSNKINGCAMDKIITLIDLNGFLLSLDSSNYKQNFNKNESISNRDFSNAKQNLGLLSDFNLWHKSDKRKLKLTDYVHSNDLGHLQKHLNDVMEKGEKLTSAIYRLKISDKFAFVQSSSKIIKNKSFDEKNQDQHGSDINRYIHTIHSIIKREIDTDIEMKGKASTSLMKTLISRKPSGSSMILNEENSEVSTAGIFPMRQKSQSCDVQPLTPIGTKFALTMLGLSKNHNQNKLAQKTVKNSTSNSSIRSNESSNEPVDKQTEDIGENDLMDMDRIEKNKLKLNLIKKKSIEDNVNVIRHPIDPNSSFKQLIKKEIMALEERKTNNVDIPKNQTKPKSIVKAKEQQPSADTLEKTNNNLLLKRLLSQENLVPSDLAKPNEVEAAKNNENQLKKKSSKTESENGSKDDIILRALLNSNDLEPQVLELESVFKLGQAANTNLNRQNSSKKSTKSESTKKDITKNDYQKNKNNNPSSISSKINSLLVKENIQLSEELEKNQLENFKNKYDRYIEQNSYDFSTPNQKSSLFIDEASNQNVQLSKSCTNLTFENISEPGSIKSEPCLTNTSKPVQHSIPVIEESENSQTKPQILNDELQKQKRIEAITKLLKSDLIESFKIALQPSNQLKGDNQASTIDFPFTEPDLGIVESEFALNEISNSAQTNYQSHYSSQESQFSCNIQKSFYQSNTNSLHSDQSKESNQLSNTETNSTALRKKLQERLNQKKSSAYAASSTFAKNQSVNIAVVSPVISSKQYAQSDQETTKSTKKDAESKPPSQNIYNEFKNPQQPPNAAYNYSLIPEPYSYATTVTVTTKHYPPQINSPSYPSMPNLKPDNSHSYPSYTTTKLPPMYDQNQGVYAPMDSANRAANELYFEPASQVNNFQCDDTAPNIEINTKINVNFQMADAYGQQNTASKYMCQNLRASDYASYDNYKKMSSSYPAYDQPIFSDQSALSNYQQNQYLRQSYESVCVNRAQSKQAEISYGSVHAKHEPNFKVHSSNDLSSINTDMCDLTNNFEEEVFNENMYFLQNLLID